MLTRNIYIRSAAQVSMQQPLSEEWITAPVDYSGEPYVRAIEAEYRQFVSPGESRRMGRIMKRAVATSSTAMKAAGLTMVDVVVTGTGLGCIENTELFLKDLFDGGEQLLKPTWFMQSTHNTLSSLIAIRMGCHGYNATYSHKGVSFDCALHDVLTQMTLGRCNTALVNGFDECTPTFYEVMRRGGYVGHSGQVPCGEIAVSMVVTTEPADALCSVEGIEVLYNLTPDKIAAAVKRLGGHFDAVLTGRNGWTEYDDAYTRLLPPEVLALPEPVRYKTLCGEMFTSSAFGIYAAAHILTGRTLVVNIDGCGQRASLLVLNTLD